MKRRNLKEKPGQKKPRRNQAISALAKRKAGVIESPVGGSHPEEELREGTAEISLGNEAKAKKKKWLINQSAEMASMQKVVKKCRREANMSKKWKLISNEENVKPENRREEIFYSIYNETENENIVWKLWRRKKSILLSENIWQKASAFYVVAYREENLINSSFEEIRNVSREENTSLMAKRS